MASVAQQVLDAIVTDTALLQGLGAAHVFRDAPYFNGKPPSALLQQLKQGPGRPPLHLGKHI